MVRKDYYKILGVKSDSSKKEIEKAYRSLVFKYHPDLQANKSEKEKKDASKKMEEINEAYEFVGDEKKRREYDLHKNDDNFQSWSNESGNFSSWKGNSDVFDEIFSSFSSFFGSKSKKSGNDRSSYSESYYSSRGENSSSNYQQRGEDILISFSLKFKEFVLGTKKEVVIELKKSCQDCNQSGYKSSSDVLICPDCKGAGVISVFIFGSIRTNTSCSRCFGSGKIIKKSCSICGGELFIKRKEKIIFNIPRGIQFDKRLRYRGVGNDGIKSKERGDIYVDLKIDKDPYYSKKDNDIHAMIPISFLDAILGSTVEIFTLEGIEKINVPKGTQNNDYLVLNGKGCYLRINSNSRGDFYIWFQIKLPKKLSSNSQSLLEKLKFDTESSWNPNKDFIEKNRKIFDI